MGFQEENHRKEPTLSSFHIKDIYYWQDLSLLMFALITGLRLLLLFTHSVVSNSFQPHGLQHTRLPCPSLSPRVCSNSCPLNQWCHPTTSSSNVPFSSHLQSFPASGSFQWVSSLHQVVKVLELQHQPFQWIFRVHFLWDWLVWSPCSPNDFQESSLAPHFESMNSLVLSLLYGPTHMCI